MEELPDVGKPTESQQQSTSFAEMLDQAIADARREAREVALMLEQSQSEADRLGQKSASILAYVHQMRERERWPEMAAACENALEAQQRHLIIRGQMEKLQQVYETLERFIKVLQDLRERSSEQAQGAVAAMPAQHSLEVLGMLMDAQESERRRLARQMHDGPAQDLSNFILQAEIASRLFEVDAKRAREELNNLKSAAANTFRQVREFIFELRPMMLDDLGLLPTLRRYLETLNNQNEATVTFKPLGQERRYAPTLEVFVFRVVQGLVSAALHERKAQHVTVTLHLGDESLKAVVEDDGTPINLEALDTSEQVGLHLLRERIEMLGGELLISSAPPDGNQVTFTVPAVLARPTAEAN